MKLRAVITFSPEDIGRMMTTEAFRQGMLTQEQANRVTSHIDEVGGELEVDIEPEPEDKETP